MASVLPPPASASSSTSSPPPQPLQPPQSSSSPSTNPNHPALPPLMTSTPKRTALQRPPPQAKVNRLSTYSSASNASQLRSRPPSQAFAIFHSSLPYTSVRDFAYPPVHPMHYGPQPERSGTVSGTSTPASEAQRRLSDPTRASWGKGGRGWSPGPWGGDVSMGAEGPLQVVWHDGPPWSEDEDLQSPVVVSSRHKKHKSSGGDTGHGRGRGQGEESEESEEDADHGSTAPRADRRGQGRGRSGAAEGETYYANEGETTADGPGGEFVTRPTGPGQGSTLATYNTPGQRDSHFAALLPNRSYNNQSAGMPFETEDDLPSARVDQRNESRYSRDYQFTIASPDEEMHGKAVALFDFARENENELPLVEGQVIWVSYRYGQGWLVAEDPKTQESGLVPEEYVRLLRDIRGGWGSLTGELTEAMMSPRQGGGEAGTPTQADPQPDLSSPTASNGSNGFPHPPVVSVFSTSSKDLDPYPHHLLGTQQGQTPPQVVHYHGQRGGSQTNTPTLSGSNDAFAQPSGGKARGNLADVSNGAAVGEKEHGKETKETKIVAGDAR